MGKQNKEEGVFYQCSTCNYVLKLEKDNAPPSYCPNCAVNHLKGAMVSVGKDAMRDMGTICNNYKIKEVR